MLRPERATVKRAGACITVSARRLRTFPYPAIPVPIGIPRSVAILQKRDKVLPGEVEAVPNFGRRNLTPPIHDIPQPVHERHQTLYGIVPPLFDLNDVPPSLEKSEDRCRTGAV